MQNVKGIIFDLDGTLLDTLADLAHAANAVLSERGCPTHDLDAYRYFVGQGVRELMRATLPESHRDEATIQQATEAFQAVYSTTWNVDTRLYDGIAAMLDRLTELNVPLAVLSNKPHRFTLECVDAYLGAWPLNPVLGQRDGVPVKPDPLGAHEILNRWSLQADEVVMMGDTRIDMRTATAAGLSPVGVTWGFRQAEELRQNGAQVLIDRPEQLFDNFTF